MRLVTDLLIVKDGSAISEEEITAQIRVLLVAGFETTAGITPFFGRRSVSGTDEDGFQPP
jgi:cytochrome P450